MAKMTDYQKENRKLYVEEIREEYLGDIFSFEAYDITVAIAPVLKTAALSKVKFFEVSVAYCNPEDKFKRKLGEYYAATRFVNGTRILFKNDNYHTLYEAACDIAYKLAA